MLEKLNSIMYDEEKGTVLKCLASHVEAKSEKACLALFSSKELSGVGQGITAPRLYAEASSEYTVCMEYVPGIRAYDLLALLNHIIRVCPDKRTVSKAHGAKHDIIASAIRMVSQFQSRKVQDALRQAEAMPLAPYDFMGKLMEAINYLQLWSTAPSNGSLIDEANHIADFLSRRANVAFRDATLKNFIIKMPVTDGVARDYREIAKSTGDYLRPTNWQWTDPKAALAMLDYLSSPDALTKSMYSLDFESAHSLTTKQDDFIHLFTLEVAGISYEIAQRFMETQLGVDEEEMNYAILLRCLRDGTRRLFYKCERSTVFATRYFHETVEHLLVAALEALERLKRNSSNGELLDGLHSLLVQFKSSPAPWPWQLSVVPMEWTIQEKVKGA